MGGDKCQWCCVTEGCNSKSKSNIVVVRPTMMHVLETVARTKRQEEKWKWKSMNTYVGNV